MASNSLSTNGREVNKIFEGQVHLYKHLFAFFDSLCLKWCVDQSVPNIIHNHGQPMTLHELVSKLQVPTAKISGVHRLMRYLAHIGFFDVVRIQENQEEKEAYALTNSSELLVRGTNHCLSSVVDFVLDPSILTSYHHLGKWIHDDGDQAPFALALGTGIWDFLSKSPTHMTSFNDATASDSQIINLALKDHGVIFEGLESIVDVAGGTGMVAKHISDTFPHLKCIVFDLPQVVKNLKGTNNLSYVGGDMFQSIPKADAVLLKWILHDWGDNDCLKILNKCKDAISNNKKRGKIIIIDIVIDDGKQDHPDITQAKLQMDLTVTTYYNGKERTTQEWKKLFTEANCQHYKISPLTGYMSLIEVYP
ncbi:hypothetical protein HN51_068066 [Arachis hypogaea]|uniref:isoflavone-7-O-methyltransferase 6-like n=1 Tax=Arachis hypogaea TaxID=3818 RepID=UPI000DECD2A0|nr:isoflavone-7-O-methyltransferase 6-like [Arachis hypogaea]XP_025697063.1 isoflavone-7-O-methyltransferase 6-like [Arachis hypogaea]XP_029153906.1 isoflavone-7-O-methyltransferase 6-like [Arachis hypogaea]